MERVKIWKPSDEEIRRASEWPIWEKGPSTFDWFYDEDEQFYLVEGEVEVELSNGDKVRFSAGDMVKFKSGTECKWNIIKKVRKHYKIG
ncbi:MAG: cupin domain-containing protein [Brevinematales bacterium]|nr:cupin domain-containing protein [Brevinematales bacterium]